ncbi:MAG TPA: hypothetical protein VKX28_23855 [Xanthobacteraceae bacterium]|nr:hypothetical protein [Xanthobacteraceae bacterium]
MAAAQAARMLAVCAAGACCRVSGVVADCEESDECPEIKRVVSIWRKVPPPRQGPSRTQARFACSRDRRCFHAAASADTGAN